MFDISCGLHFGIWDGQCFVINKNESFTLKEITV